ncbi:MAG: cytidine deaminase [Pseudomonadota bacterium]|nr:cytidine deaminase [Pseudomonadota bacterium]
MTIDPKAQELIAAATDIITARYKPDWHVVGAALRLGDGTIVTGVHIDANVGRIAVCAEAIALGRAVTEYGRTDVTMIAAVRMDDNLIAGLVTPCGMCREMLTDYAPQALVVLPTETGPAVVKAMDLLPNKYVR